MLADLDDVVRLMDVEFFMSYPYDVFARMRNEAPVYWSERDAMWALTKYEDIREVSKSPHRFANGYGIGIQQGRIQDDGRTVADTGGCPMPRRAALRARMDADSLGADHIVSADPPRHTFLRKIASYAFTPKAVQQLEDEVRSYTVETLDRIEPDVVTDFVDAVAAPVPMMVIARMLGVPTAHLERFRRWSDAFIELGDESTVSDPTLIAHHASQVLEFRDYFTRELEDRETRPRGDLLTDLVSASDDGTPLTRDQQLAMTQILLIAGNETTRGLISGAGKLLWEHPDQRRLLVEQPELIPNAVEELLRVTTPVTHMCRTALEDTTLRGQSIARGDYLVLMYAAANRDEDIWGRSEELDVTRTPDPAHVAFGFAEHFCLGAALARREARLVLGELLRRFPNYELVGPVERFRAFMTPGIKTMPTVFHE